MRWNKYVADQRGQLNMMETLIAVSLLIVVSVAISTSVMNQSGESDHSISWLTSQGRHILSSADDLGILRPAVYLADSSAFASDASSFQSELEIMISSQLPTIAQFLVIRVDLENIGRDGGIPIVDTGSRPDENTEVVVASYLLGGYSSSEYGTFEAVYAVYLHIWLLV